MGVGCGSSIPRGISMSRPGLVRVIVALLLGALIAGVAHADLVTYHVTGVSADSDLGVSGGVPLGLEFTIDDTTAPSFASAQLAAYTGAIASGFLRYGGSIFALSGFNAVAFSNDLDVGGAPSLLDQFLLQADLAPGGSVPALGEPLTVLIILTTFEPSPTALTSVELTQPLVPASGFQFNSFNVAFFEDFVRGAVSTGPLPGPLPAAEPPAMALVGAALGLLASMRGRRRRASPGIPAPAA